MAKFCGKIGYAATTEDPLNPGIWTPGITEITYYGDVIRDTRRLSSNDKVNDDISLSNQISVIADAFAQKNFHAIRYVEYMNAKWKVTDVEVRYPRLILTVGGLYND